MCRHCFNKRLFLQLILESVCFQLMWMGFAVFANKITCKQIHIPSSIYGQSMFILYIDYLKIVPQSLIHGNK